MASIKEQISQLRKNTPKPVQWLLLVVAFVVVLILLTLLVSGDDAPEDLSSKDTVAPEIKLNPDKPINWTGTVVGEKRTIKITVTANAPVTFVSVDDNVSAEGLTINNTCVGIRQINQKLSCSVDLTYAPTAATDDTEIVIPIRWRDAADKNAIQKENGIVLSLGAVAPVIEEEPEPVIVTPEPEVIEEEPEPVIVTPEPKPVQTEIIREVETIAPPIVFEEEVAVEEPVAEACSDFSFPGYGLSGRQIGWIKPEGGAYYFHPFSDVDCTEPTGVYNPGSGIIYDIDDEKTKIGTDAEHINTSVFDTGILPQLSNAPAIKPEYRARQLDVEAAQLRSSGGARRLSAAGTFRDAAQQNEDGSIMKKKKEDVYYVPSGSAVKSSQPYDRTFVLRQYKPIPATIVSDVLADIEALQNGKSLPVRATVDRNVYSDNGRTVILPAGTLMLGYVTGEIPGPYKAIGRMQIQWYQFIRPDGVEFNFEGDNDPFSADAQGRVGVPGRGSTDYMEQFIMPMLTAFVPAAVNLINPVADAFVNQIDLDNNTVVQSGMVRSSELAKNEIITAWNGVAQKLLVDMMDNTVPPFTIAAGTRITVYSPEDLRVVCTDETKKCWFGLDEDHTGGERQDWTGRHGGTQGIFAADDNSWVGQARSFQVDGICSKDADGLWRAPADCFTTGKTSHNGYSCTTLKLYCESLNYQSKKALQYEAYKEDQKKQYDQKVQDLGGQGSQQFNEEILGVKYGADGTVQNPYQSSDASDPAPETGAVLTCEDGNPPDENGCCAGEIYTDMGEQGFNCCPSAGGDCFPPLI